MLKGSEVSITRCGSYEPMAVQEAVRRAVDLIGGIGAFVGRGSKVLIKPNMLGPHTPEEGVCTHPEVVRAVVRLVKKAGGDPIVGDSPGTFFATHNKQEVLEKTGIKRVADEEGVPSLTFDKSIIVNGIPITRLARDCDVIVNLPKIKTHVLTKMTCAVKNMFGMVTGVHKVELHRNSPSPRDFVKRVADVYEVSKPHLSIVDGIVGMQGDGPSWGELRDIGLVLAGADAVSVDAVVSDIVGLPFAQDISLNEVVRRGLGEGLIENIEVLGEPLDAVRIPDFKHSQTSRISTNVPSPVARLAAGLLNFVPFIKNDVCKRCRVCVECCPVDAITLGKEMSIIDNAKCVKCFCCYEMCPHRAIMIKKNFFARLLWK